MCLQRLCGFCFYCFELVRQERDCWSRGIAQRASIMGVIFPSVLTSRGLLFLLPCVAPKSVFSVVFFLACSGVVPAVGLGSPAQANHPGCCCDFKHQHSKEFRGNPLPGATSTAAA